MMRLAIEVHFQINNAIKIGILYRKIMLLWFPTGSWSMIQHTSTCHLIIISGINFRLHLSLYMKLYKEFKHSTSLLLTYLGIAKDDDPKLMIRNWRMLLGNSTIQINIWMRRVLSSVEMPSSASHSYMFGNCNNNSSRTKFGVSSSAQQLIHPDTGHWPALHSGTSSSSLRKRSLLQRVLK